MDDELGKEFKASLMRGVLAPNAPWREARESQGTPHLLIPVLPRDSYHRCRPECVPQAPHKQGRVSSTTSCCSPIVIGVTLSSMGSRGRVGEGRGGDEDERGWSGGAQMQELDEGGAVSELMCVQVYQLHELSLTLQ